MAHISRSVQIDFKRAEKKESCYVATVQGKSSDREKTRENVPWAIICDSRNVTSISKQEKRGSD